MGRPHRQIFRITTILFLYLFIFLLCNDLRKSLFSVSVLVYASVLSTFCELKKLPKQPLKKLLETCLWYFFNVITWGIRKQFGRFTYVA